MNIFLIIQWPTTTRNLHYTKFDINIGNNKKHLIIYSSSSTCGFTMIMLYRLLISLKTEQYTFNSGTHIFTRNFSVALLHLSCYLVGFIGCVEVFSTSVKVVWWNNYHLRWIPNVFFWGSLNHHIPGLGNNKFLSENMCHVN